VLLKTARQAAGTLSEFGIDIGTLDDDAHPQIAVNAVFIARL
jgi:hypothetical protein